MKSGVGGERMPHCGHFWTPALTCHFSVILAACHMLSRYWVSHVMMGRDPCFSLAVDGHVTRSDLGGRCSVVGEARIRPGSAYEGNTGVCAARAQRVLPAPGPQHTQGHGAASETGRAGGE